MERKISIMEELDGTKTVFIHDIIFTGKRAINWEEVELYLRKYIDEVYCLAETGEEIFIGKELPSEYTGSVYTKKSMKPAKSNGITCLKHVFW